MNATHDQIFHIVCKHCGVAYIGSDAGKEHIRNYDLSRETFQNLTLRLAHMHGVAHVWMRPGSVESEAERLRTKLASTIEAIKGIDRYAMVLARNVADRARKEEFDEAVLRLERDNLSQEEHRVALEKLCAEYKPQPIEKWVDQAAISALNALRDALVLPIERAIPNAPTGAGRPPNRRAYGVAESAYLIFEEVTGRKPTFWNGGETDFSRLVEELFQVYGIKSTLRKPIEAAMHKFDNAA